MRCPLGVWGRRIGILVMPDMEWMLVMDYLVLVTVDQGIIRHFADCGSGVDVGNGGSCTDDS